MASRSEPSSKPRQAAERAAERATPSSDHIDHGPRRPHPEQLRRALTTRPRLERLCRAPTTSTTRPRRNDDCREERRYDNRDHRHDDRSESSRIGQLHHRRPDFYPKISTLLIFIFNIIFITTFLHNVLIIIILQITYTSYTCTEQNQLMEPNSYMTTNTICN